MQITVNADDFGMNENATRAICECFRRGIVTRTTAMVNMPWFGKAIEMARDEGFSGRIGLHVNLVEGLPLTSAIRKCRFWCNDDGSFNGTRWRNKLWRFWMPREAVRLAAEEIDAQMKAFLASGLPLRHFDSHQYVCTYWPLAEVSCDLAKRNGFVSTRSFFTAPRRQFYCAYVNKIIDRHGLKRPDVTIFTRDIPSLETKFRSCSSVEVHCHPNRRDGEGNYDPNGELKDWKTDYADSLRLCEGLAP